MDLAARRSSRQREDFVMRLGCVLVSLAVLASLILEPPKARAFAMTSSAVTALAGGFLNACGLAPVVSGMGSSSEVNESVARLLQEFLDEEVFGTTVADWALSFGEIGLAVKDKKIIIPKPLAEKLGQFAQWVAGKYGTKLGVNVVYSSQSITFYDGSTYMLSQFLNPEEAREDGAIFSSTNYALGTSIPFPYGTSEANYHEIALSPRYSVRFYRTDSVRYFSIYLDNALVRTYQGFDLSVSPITFMTYPLGVDLKSGLELAGVYPSGVLWGNFSGVLSIHADYISSSINDESLSLDVSESITIPEGLTDSQSVALDVGAAQSMTIQEILQGILDAILAGDLAASAEIVDEAVEPVDPDPPVVPVVPEGLDKLGAALTSRFPFSIPWDVYKGVTLLAAPPKAPYFEVDFLEPIGHLVGGWKGSTKIVLDMSEYEIIGQVCRWTSTIGFCLMLATGTKRLIWTA